MSDPHPRAGALPTAAKAPNGVDFHSLPEAPAPMRQPKARITFAESLTGAVVLSIVAGYLDGFTYVGHGRIFASAMTGNMVLLGINLGHLDAQALGNLYPLLAFIVGVVIANLLTRAGVRRFLPLPPHFAALVVEIAVLAAIAFWPAVTDDHLLVAVVTLTAAVQNTTFRTVEARPYNSVIMTGNLQNLSKALAQDVWSGGRPAWAQVRDLGSVLAAFVAGAAGGAAATPRFGNLATLAPALLLTAVALVLARAVSRGDAAED